MKRGYVDTDRGQLHTWRTGSGPDLILLHQSTQNADEYLSFAPLLADRYTVTAIEWLGHGKSADPTQMPTMSDYSRTLIQAINGLSIETMALVGHHGGASIAIDVAATIPERVTKLVASGTGYRSPEEVAEMLAHRTAAEEAITEDGAFLKRMWGVYAKLGSPGTPMATLHKIFLNNMQERLKPFDAHDPILAWDKGEACAKVRCPVLLLQGELDTFVTGQEKLLDIFANVTRTVMPDTGPFCFYDRPQDMATVVDAFLAEG